MVPEDPSLDMSGTMTLTAWVKPLDANRAHGILAKNPTAVQRPELPGNYEFRLEAGSRTGHLLYQTFQNQDDLQLKPVPWLRLLSFRYPVIDYFRAVRAHGDPLLPDPKPSFLIITRQDYIVRTHPITATQYHLLQCLVVGQTISEAIRNCSPTGNIDAAWIKQWIDLGLFVES